MALEFCHKNGIVHCDLRPETILHCESIEKNFIRHIWKIGGFERAAK